MDVRAMGSEHCVTIIQIIFSISISGTYPVHVLFLQYIKPGSIWKMTAFVQQVRKAADCVALEVNVTEDPKSE
jgi:hypothetical protein